MLIDIVDTLVYCLISLSTMYKLWFKPLNQPLINVFFLIRVVVYH